MISFHVGLAVKVMKRLWRSYWSIRIVKAKIRHRVLRDRMSSSHDRGGPQAISLLTKSQLVEELCCKPVHSAPGMDAIGVVRSIGLRVAMAEKV